jgi:hypothetical protein
VIESAFFFIDAVGVGIKGIKGAAGLAVKKAGAEALEKAAGTAALKGLKSMGAEEAAEAAAKGINELGVKSAADAAGMSVDDLLKKVGEESAAGLQIKAYQKLAKEGVEVAKLPAALKTAMEGGEVIGQNGVKMTAEEVAKQAVDTLGFQGTLKAAGDWKSLASALGPASEVGKRFNAWRQGIRADLEAFIKTLGKEGETLDDLIKPTGTLENMTNDLDISLLGARSSENKEAAARFLAGRTGLSPDAAVLDKMLYIGLFTDPRRMHLFDAFPELQAKLAKRTMKFEEELIWNDEYAKYLTKAEKGGAGAAAAKEMAEKIGAEMDSLGVKKLPGFRSLSDRAASVLSKEQDKLHEAILTASKAGDMTKAESLIEELANIQAQINVKEGGGYFSAGGVRKFVTEREGFPGARAAATAAHDLGAATDQVNKLRKAIAAFEGAALVPPASRDAAEIAKHLKDVAKYGERFADAASVIGTKGAEGAALATIADEFSQILLQARGASVHTLQDLLAKNMEGVITKARGAIAVYDQSHVAIIRALRERAAIEGMGDLAPEILRATKARYAWLTFQSALITQMGTAARAAGLPIQEAIREDAESGPAPEPSSDAEQPKGDFPPQPAPTVATSRIDRQSADGSHAGPRLAPRSRPITADKNARVFETEVQDLAGRVAAGSRPAMDPWSLVRGPGALLAPLPVALTAASRPSGIRIQRQNVQVASGRTVGDLEGAQSNLREDVLAVMDRLHMLWSLTNDEYSAEYPRVAGTAQASKLKPASIPNTIAGLKKNAEGHLHNEPAKVIFGIGLGGPVGKGQANAKPDVLAIQGALKGKGMLPEPAYKLENDAVEAGPDADQEKDIPQTNAAIGRLKMGSVRAEALIPGATDLPPDKVSEVEKALTPGVPRMAGGAPAPFVDKVKGVTYEQDLLAKLDFSRKWMYPRAKKKLGGKKLPMSKFEDVGQKAKQVTDDLFGRFATGPEFKAGTAASGANLIDRSLETPDAADLVRYLLHNQAEVLPVHKKHHAIPDRPTEKSIIQGIIGTYTAKHKAELETIDRAWPALASQGIVQLQVFEGATAKDTRRILWKSFQTMIHEYLHTVTHPNYGRIAGQIGGAKESILIEGGTSLFTDKVWKAIFPGKISSDAALRASVEGAVEPYDASVIPAISHYDQIADARNIESIVGEDNFKGAYFLGKTELIGFPAVAPGGLATAGANQQFTVPPSGVETVADVAYQTGAKVEELAALNHLKINDTVRPGQVLAVPGLVGGGP